MAVLPVMFWCGKPYLGRFMTNILAAGVFSSGFVKDLLCLPRPLSPPLTRITMSGSAALEYGFPSTHSTNAVSVAVFSILLLQDPEISILPQARLYLQVAAYLYACSIVMGRLYCGMHGFFDVVCGSLLGAVVALAQFYLGPIRDEWLFSGEIKNVLISGLIVLLLVRIHPEPADNCPCFDDSVAFAGVVWGLDIGGWHISRTQYVDTAANYPSAIPFNVEQLGWSKVIARIVLGVVSVFVWRAVAKPTLLTILPPIFRVVESLGLDLPRRYFKRASEYQSVPDQKDDDNVIPSARDIPQMLGNLRNRRRAVSIGPQSEADAYEALAYRQKRRRDSIKGAETSLIAESKVANDYFANLPDIPTQSRKRSLSLEEFRQQMGASLSELSPIAIGSPQPEKVNGGSETFMKAADEKDRSELFATVQKVRVRYDVEVVTKLIVYGGIGWIAVEGAPMLFHHLWLSTYRVG
ncbi:Long-chain base-1-phosphate phosphatase [Lithohypha guttulata]|nr:Long-chain base-1-phosphate phosphatase [Lithohypha guttulata]